DGATFLAAGDPAKFMNAVAMRATPKRPKPNHTDKKDIQKKIEPLDTRTPIQKLVDKFGY
ncbi:MAG: aminoacyl-tRNA hydrolase, partial [Rhodobacterales bacterium]